MDLPYLTNHLPGIGGRIKENVEDFRVDEAALYAPCGRGTHAYFRVTKMGVPTPVAVNRIARHMGVRPTDIGVAGLKDAQAVTTQWMSLEHANVDRLRRFRDSQVQVSDITFHGNKLRIGHLAGNRFAIRIRGVGEGKLPAARRVLEALERRGVPNFFGEQRFGARGDTAALGAAMVRNDLDEFVRIFLGRSIPDDPPDCKAARDAFDAGYLDRALQRWPRHYVDPRKALIAYKRRRSPVAALAAIDKRMKRLYVSAFQSEIFNDVLTARLDGLDAVLPGDLAEKTDSGGVFPVEDAAREQPRASAFEISATGPIVGYRCNLAEGEPGRIEREILAKYRVTQEDFTRVDHLRAKGTRRALRFRLGEPNLAAWRDARGEFIEVTFTAPSGCYATVALREIMKNDLP
ncbi:MAG TPA: tRNA pseudouridine(13) synthase TruD [Phycisphaerales bacterium]|nr:tRNA pseudouridine(13) synthase TruD [Phycisphaerales bacterium]